MTVAPVSTDDACVFVFSYYADVEITKDTLIMAIISVALFGIISDALWTEFHEFLY
jgi:hypothetical protein